MGRTCIAPALLSLVVTVHSTFLHLETAREGQAQPSRKWKTGEFMEYQVLEGADAGSSVKCSIEKEGDFPDTYDIYLWAGDPKARHLRNIPAELLKSAKEEDAKRKAELEAQKEALEEAEKQRKAKELAERLERERLAKEAREREEKLRVEREAAEARQRAAEEEAKKAEAEIARLKALEAERQLKVQEEKEAAEIADALQKRKAWLKVRWEEKLAEKRLLEADARAKGEVISETRLEDLREARRQNLVLDAMRPTKAPEKEEEEELHEDVPLTGSVKLSIRIPGGREVLLELKRGRRLKPALMVACERLGLVLEKSKFKMGEKVLKLTDTAEVFGKKDFGVIMVEGPSKEGSAPARAAVAQAPVVEEAAPVAPPAATQLARQVLARPEEAFQTGDFAEAKDPGHAGVPCTIAGRGASPETYNVQFAFLPGGGRRVQDVPAHMLSKVKGRTYAEAMKRFKADPDDASQAVDRVSQKFAGAI